MKSKKIIIIFILFLIFFLSNSKDIDLMDLKNRYTLIKEKILELKKNGYNISEFIKINTQIQNARKEKNYKEVLRLIEEAEKKLKINNHNEKKLKNSTIIEQNNASGSISFLSVKGNKIINEKGEEVRLRGVQLDFGSGRGLLEITENEEIETFLNQVMDYTVTEEDFIDLKSMGVNAARFSLSCYKDFEYDTTPFFYREKNFMKLDKIIEWAEKYNIYLIISMRQSPGGHNPAKHSGNKGKNQLWKNTTCQDRLAALWKEIALRYSNIPIIAGYDLMNEPMAPDKATLNKVYSKITNAIREVDNNHIIFLEGNKWAIDLDWIYPPKDKNTALSIHFYEPGFYATDGKGTYPSVINGKHFNKDTLRKKLADRIEYAKKINRPIFVGEFGVPSKCNNYLQYINDVIDLLEGQDLNWIYWHYKNKRGLSDTWAIYYTNSENKFLKLALAIKTGESISSYSDTKITKALESLKTKYFDVKQDLKKLISQYMINK